MHYTLFLLLSLLSLPTRAQSPVPKLPSTPKSIVVDSKDNVIVHIYRGRIMKLTPDGKLSYINEDIQKEAKRPPYPGCNAMAIDGQDNIYMADESVIWKLTPDGKITLFAGVPFMSRVKDGPLQTAQFRSIELIEIDPAGTIYVAERDNTNKDNLGDFYLIRKIDTKGMVTTLVNTRENPALQTKWIADMGIDAVGNLYLSDGDGRCIKKLAPNGTVTTVAGLCGKREFRPIYVQGDISKAELMAPEDILINKKGEVIFSDGRLHRIIKIADNKVTTIAGGSVIQSNSVNMGGRAQEGYKDGNALVALFNFPLGCDIAIDSRQNIYIIDGGNDCIRKLSPDGMVTTVAK
ncbi:NHL repeat-containing protein [Spirosoma aerophilum]